jgi:hypothetical protein
MPCHWLDNARCSECNKYIVLEACCTSGMLSLLLCKPPCCAEPNNVATHPALLCRFSAKSDTLLGMNGHGPVIWAGMELFQLVATAANPYPTRNAWMSDIFEQLLICRCAQRMAPDAAAR